MMENLWIRGIMSVITRTVTDLHGMMSESDADVCGMCLR